MRFSRAFILVFLSLISYYSGAQVFNAQNLTFSPALDIYAKVEWVDIDRDGNLDVLAFRWDMYGFDNNYVSVFKNTGNAFEQVTAPFGTDVPHLNPASYALADYDLDGDVDILILDYQSLKIANNNGDFSFSFVDVGVSASYYYSVQWVDIENDGDLDIIANQDNQGYSILLNNNGAYTTSIHALPIYLRTLSPADINNDGLIDFAGSTGQTTDNPIVILENKGDGSFGKQMLAQTAPLFDNGKMEWLDADGDHDLDLFITGGDNSCKLFKNMFHETGQATFTVAYQFDTMQSPAIDAGDVNLDGLPDLVLYGTVNYVDHKTFLYLNHSGSDSLRFTKVDLGISNYFVSNLELVDLNHDQKLDIFLMGGEDYFNSIQVRTAYYSTITNPLPPPAAPAGLSTVPGDHRVLSWAPVPYAGSLFYTLEMKRNGTLFVPSLSSDNGTSLSPRRGIKRPGTTFNLGDLPSGNFSWRVQAVDEGQRRSAFSPELPFSVAYPPYFIGAEQIELTHIKLIWADSVQGKTAISVFRSSNTEAVEKIVTLAPAATTYTDTDVSPNHTYVYSVRSENNGVLSASSNAVTVEIKLFMEHFFPDSLNLESNTGKAIDVDNDNDYDLALLGEAHYSGTATLLKNDGSGKYTPTTGFLPGTSTQDHEFFVRDLDNDGDEDICLLQGDYPYSIKVFRNDLGTWTKTFETSQELYIYDYALEDFNHDGLIDILYGQSVGNNTGLSKFTLLYQKSISEFVDSKINFFPGENVVSGVFGVADFDNDGFEDILVTPPGYNSPPMPSRMLKNLGGNSFQEVPTNLPFLNKIVPFDVNQDGKIDLVNRAETGFSVYQNSGNFQFQLTTPIADGVSLNNSIRNYQLADFDLNGLPDLLVEDAGGNVTLLQNDGEQGFWAVQSFRASAGLGGHGVLSDYDRDGDLDIMKLNDYYLYFPNPYYENKIVSDISFVTNAAPAIPLNVQSDLTVANVQLSWDPSTDDKTPGAYLSYNLELRNSSNQILVSPEMDASSTFHKRIGAGNMGNRTRYSINHLPAGTYMARVQAVDAAFKFSTFSVPAQFTIPHGPYDLTIERILLNKIKLTWKDTVAGETKILVERKSLESDFAIVAELSPGTTTYTDSGLTYNKTYTYRVYAMIGAVSSASSNWADWSTNLFVRTETTIPNVYGVVDVGDITADGKMDLLIAGGRIENGSFAEIVSAVFENTDAGWERHNVGSTTIGAQTAAISFQDMNGDSKLDLFESGYTFTTDPYQTEVFLSNGDKTWSSTTDIFTTNHYTILNWWDFDMDNDLDVYGFQPNTYNPFIRSLVRNDGQGNFNIVDNANVTCYNSCPPQSYVFGDFDRDGDEDKLEYSYPNNGAGYFLSLNNNGTPVSTNSFLPSSFGTKVQVIDYNGDGWLDVFVLVDYGTYSQSYGPKTRLFKNLGTDSLGIPRFQIALDDLPIGDRTDCGWADYDHDGDLDLFIANPDFRIYTNEGANGFSVYTIRDFHASLNSAKWIDFDNDGDLDLYVDGYIGYITAGEYHSKSIVLNNQLINNQTGIPNMPPSAPTGLTSHQDEYGMHLTWDSPVDDHTPGSGLSYDVVVYKSDGTSVSKGSVDPTTGVRLKLESGRTISSFLLNNQAVGNYTWKVQAIDQSYAGSALSDAGQFFMLPPTPVMNDTTIYACGRVITLTAGGQNIEWFSDVALSTMIATGVFHPSTSQTVYVTQTIQESRSAGNTVHITIYDRPASPAIYRDSVNYCKNQSVYLQASGVNLRWYSNPNMSNQVGNGLAITAPAAIADFYVTQTIADCESVPSKIVVRPALDSRIYESHDTLYTYARNALYYQWGVDNVYIPNSNNYYIIQKQDGVYTVIVQTNLCYEVSDPFVVLGLPESSADLNCNIFPNPTGGNFDITFSHPTDVTVEILDGMGKSVYQNSFEDTSGSVTVQTNGWSKGVYIILIKGKSGVVARKMIVN